VEELLMAENDLRRFAERIHTGIRDAYDSKALDKMVFLHLNERLDHIAGDSLDFDTTVFRLVLWADQRGRLLDLARAGASERPTRTELEELLKEMESALAAPKPRRAARAAADGEPLPDELTSLLRAYERIRKVMMRGPERRTMSVEMADSIRSLPVEQLSLPSRLHLSDLAGDRLAAVITLHKSPDPAYLRWLSERVWVEPRFVGLMAAQALQEAARRLPLAHLDRVQVALDTTKKCLDQLDTLHGRDRQVLDVIANAKRVVAKRSV
jgi:hypothetical protein